MCQAGADNLAMTQDEVAAPTTSDLCTQEEEAHGSRSDNIQVEADIELTPTSIKKSNKNIKNKPTKEELVLNPMSVDV